MRRTLSLLMICLFIILPTSAQEEPIVHIVQAGDTVYLLSLRYGVSMNAIGTLNNLPDMRQIEVGQRLLIPAGGTPQAASPPEAQPIVSGESSLYTVVAGDTLSIIGRRFGVSYMDIATANNISDPGQIEVGQQLIIPAGGTFVPLEQPVTAPDTPQEAQPVASGESSLYTVVAGDTLSIIGRRFGVSYMDIATANNIINPGQIEVGQQLIIPAGGTVTTSSTVTTTGSNNTNTIAPSNSAIPGYDAAWAKVTGTPVLHNITGGRAYSAFQRGQQLGNNRNVFMKVGDSVTANQPFLFAYGGSGYNLGGYGHLQSTVNFFKSSFDRTSMAAQSGFTSNAVVSTIWTNPAVCGADVTPLRCEYNMLKPSVAIILFGGQDLHYLSPSMFRESMREMVNDLLSWGVIPIITTFPHHPDYYPQQAVIFNAINIDVANEFGVPLINLWRDIQQMPDYGVKEDMYHLNHTWNTEYSFNGEENIYGNNKRNLLTLQALEQLRVSVLGG